MGSLLPEPRGASLPLLLLFLQMMAANTARQTVSNPTAVPPKTVIRLTSEPGLLSSQGRTPSGGVLPRGTCLLSRRSREMCWRFVPRLFSAPISRASEGVLLMALFFQLLAGAWGSTAWYWYSRLLLPIPRWLLSLDLTV